MFEGLDTTSLDGPVDGLLEPLVEREIQDDLGRETRVERHGGGRTIESEILRLCDARSLEQSVDDLGSAAVREADE